MVRPSALTAAENGPAEPATEARPSLLRNEPKALSTRADGGWPAPVFVMILITPPTAPSPYSTAPLLPREISMRSTLLSGIDEKSKPCRSKSLKRRPFTSTSTFDGALAPKPRKSTMSRAPLTPAPMCWIWKPACSVMISVSVWRGDRAISSAVMMLVEVPVMPPLPRRDAPTSIGGNVKPPAGAASCAVATCTNEASANTAPHTLL